MAKLKLLYVEYTFAFLLLLGGFALTTVAASIYQQHYNTQVAASFKEAAHERIQAISDFLDYSLFTIRSVDAFYEASTDVNESEFSTFIKPLVEKTAPISAPLPGRLLLPIHSAKTSSLSWRFTIPVLPSQQETQTVNSLRKAGKTVIYPLLILSRRAMRQTDWGTTLTVTTCAKPPLMQPVPNTTPAHHVC